MIRIIITPQQQVISFPIPKDYIGKEIEVIAFAKDEARSTVKTDKKKVSFTALHVDTKCYKFNRDEANER